MTLEKDMVLLFFKPELYPPPAIPRSGDPYLYYQDSEYVPPQMQEQQTASTIEDMALAIRTVTFSLTLSNIATSVALSSSMQLLWGYINSMQLISVIPLLNLGVPSNLYYLCSLTSGPLALRIADVSKVTSKIFKLNIDDVNGYSPIFIMFGYNNEHFLIDI